MSEALPTPLPEPLHAEVIPPTATRELVPALVTRTGGQAQRRFEEFFAATIRNRNTRATYYRAVCKFCAWCETRGVTDLRQVEPLITAAFIEEETHRRNPQTVKQELAAIRGLFDYLVTGQIVPFNPASSVRGPSYSADKGKTPVLTPEEARQLLDSIPITRKDGTPNLVRLQDHALIALMIYTF